jgi:hypothetical protein
MPKKKGSASLPFTPHEIIKDYRLAYQSRQTSVIEHREVLSGASADWFLAKVKEILENWS